MLVYLFICIVLFFLMDAAGGFVWDFANALGYCGLAALITLGWGSESPAKSPSVRLHSNFSLVVTSLVAVHILVLLISDEIVIEYLKLKAPLYMLAGIVAAVLIGFITLTSYPSMRRVTYQRFPVFRKLHLMLSTSAIVLAVWHVVGSGFYQHTIGLQIGLVFFALGLPLAGFVARRHLGKPLHTSFVGSKLHADLQGYQSIGAAVVMSLLFAFMKNL
jgi:hypothetical protein